MPFQVPRFPSSLLNACPGSSPLTFNACLVPCPRPSGLQLPGRAPGLHCDWPRPRPLLCHAALPAHTSPGRARTAYACQAALPVYTVTRRASGFHCARPHSWLILATGRAASPPSARRRPRLHSPRTGSACPDGLFLSSQRWVLIFVLRYPQRWVVRTWPPLASRQRPTTCKALRPKHLFSQLLFF